MIAATAGEATVTQDEKDQLDELWRKHTNREPLPGTHSAGTGPNGEQEITTVDKAWTRKSADKEWTEVPPWKGHLDPEGTKG